MEVPMKSAFTNIIRSMSHTILLSLAISNLASGFNFNMRVMAKMQADGANNSKEAMYEVNGHRITITLDSAKELRRVFRAQVDKQKQEFNDYPLLEPAEPRISHRVQAPAEARVFYRFLAKTKRNSDGLWSVEPIAIQRVFR